uniref:RNase H type-1 domain-containing protein n=1 Tax=Cannabis sativa TaxID=3483 RepID=A0A803PJI4_CANSA
MEGAATIFETIWRERNDLVHNGKCIPLNQLIIHTNRRLLELIQNQDTTEVTPTTWLPPPIGWHMCNTDVAMGVNSSAGAAVFRIDDGSITDIHTTRIMQCDPLAGELYTLTWGAEQAAKLGLKNVIFQSDSKGVVEAIKGVFSKDSDLHFNITNLVVRFHATAKKFELWEACWIPRIANCVAHDVARWANRSSRFGEVEPSNFHSFLHVSTADGCSNDLS